MNFAAQINSILAALILLTAFGGYTGFYTSLHGRASFSPSAQQ